MVNSLDKIVIEHVKFIKSIHSSKFNHLILTSPIGVRNPEFDDILIKRFSISDFIFLFIKYLIHLFFAVPYALGKLLKNGKSIYFRCEKQNRNCIFMSNSLYSNGTFNYTSLEEYNTSSKFIYSHFRKNNYIKRTYLSNIFIFITLIRLLVLPIRKSVLINLLYPAGSIYQLLILIKYYTYVIRLSWMSYYNFLNLLKNETDANDFNQVFYPHEMFCDSLIIWKHFRSIGVKTITVQHTTLAKGKLHYFRHKDEWDMGITPPDIFIVNSEYDKNMLKDFYPDDCRLLVAGTPRLSKNLFIRDNTLNAQNSYLFISTGTWYEIRVLFNFVLKFIKQNNSKNYIIRLHPAAKLDFLNKLILAIVKMKKGVTISKKSIKYDLKNSASVYGIGTTLLYELALAGYDVYVIDTDKYFVYHTIDYFNPEHVISLNQNSISVANNSNSLKRKYVKILSEMFDESRNQINVFEVSK